MKARARKRARAALPESLEDAPGRKEALVMLLEHSVTGRRYWSCSIEREPLRLGPWTEPDWVKAEMGGRLIGLSEGPVAKGAV